MTCANAGGLFLVSRSSDLGMLETLNLSCWERGRTRSSNALGFSWAEGSVGGF